MKKYLKRISPALIVALTFATSVAASANSMATAKLTMPALDPVSVIRTPLMDRPSLHRVYADALLELALDASRPEYGDYKIVQQVNETVIDRQLADLASNKLSVAVSMPTEAWLQSGQVIQFPIMKGLASYRLFFMDKNIKRHIESAQTLAALKQFKVGQGRGWSTASILENHGFDVVYAPGYSALFPMLAAKRYDLLMRGVYEVEVELFANKPLMPNLMVADSVAVYTYLPMYYFVTKSQPILAERIEFGLKKIHQNGQFDKLFKEYFWGAVKLLDASSRTIFYLHNSNIESSFLARDKKYLLGIVHSTVQPKPELKP